MATTNSHLYLSGRHLPVLTVSLYSNRDGSTVVVTYKRSKLYYHQRISKH